MYVHRQAQVDVAMRVAGCFCFCQGRLLLIQRQAGKSLPLLWGVPSGKLEIGETARDAVVRELAEEVGLVVGADEPVEVIGALVGEGAEVFEYVSFHLELTSVPELTRQADAVREIDWVLPEAIGFRQMVPFFFNTLNDVMEWRRRGSVSLRSEPEAEALPFGDRTRSVT